MIKQYIVKLINGFEHKLNVANEDSARFITAALYPKLEIISVLVSL